MDRLEQQANDLVAQSDAEGAALAIGKAAMMAEILANDSQGKHRKSLYEGAALLYRGQEQGLRALALYERAGGQPPASAAVCQYLEEGTKKIWASNNLLEKISSIDKHYLQDRHEEFLRSNKEWKRFFQELYEDLACWKSHRGTEH